MLANRADTYNLGDVVGENAEAFELSYLENCLTSNSTLQPLQSRSRADIQSLIKMAREEKAQGVSLEGNFSIEEINEIVAVLRKLLKARDVLLKVNALYIASAAQADEYRTEPSFKLQGSYRDMNKIAERVVAIMNDSELTTLLMTHFENQAQTLTSGAEANLLKFKELMGWLSAEETERWSDICRTFKRNLLLGGAGADDRLGQVIAQMTTFSEGLYEIRKALERGVARLSDVEAMTHPTPSPMDPEAITATHLADAVQLLGELGTRLGGIEQAIAAQPPITLTAPTSQGERQERPPKIEVVTKVPAQFLDVIKAQFAVLQTWFDPLCRLTEMRGEEVDSLRNAIEESKTRYEQLLKRIDKDLKRKS